MPSNFFGMVSALKQLLKSSVQPEGNNNKKTQPTFATSFFQAQRDVLCWSHETNKLLSFNCKILYLEVQI